jgi:double-stranded uracil-DNA glycosylase
MGRGGSAAARLLSLKPGLPPIVRDDAKILILGSLPGDASLKVRQYYAHPRNHFWQLIGDVIGRNLVMLEYPARIRALRDAGIALWDVVGEAHRHGSLDQKIQYAQLNDLCTFVSRLPDLKVIAFNGKKAGSLGAPAFDGQPVDLLHLPSSSPAYTLDLRTKAKHWVALARYL